MGKIVKKEIETYRCYIIYDIIDAANIHHYMATSSFLTDGCVTQVGSTLEEVKANIDKVHQRIKLLSTLKRMR
jgi:hypothetical protein